MDEPNPANTTSGEGQILRYTQYMKKYLLWLLTLSWAFLIWHLTITPQIVVTEDFWLQEVLMMGAHFIFFGVQAMFLFLALRTNISALILSSAYGLIIELAQRTIPGRSADPLDWLLDTLGAITFLVIISKLKTKHYL